MPPQRPEKKRQSETLAPPESYASKRIKPSPERKTQAKGSKRTIGPVIALDTPILQPEEHINDYTLSLFTEAKVPGA
jgi:hypothetical protein